MESFEKNKNNIEESKEIMNLLKDFSVSNRVEMLQVINNLRPVAEFLTIVDDKKFPPLKNILENNGYFCIHGGKRNEKFDIFFISKNKSFAEEVKNLLDKDNTVNEKLHKRFGELMGFPQTAVDGFISGKKISIKEKENIIGFQDLFFNFTLSQDHFKEEIEYLKKCNKVLIEQAPYLIDELLSKEDAEKYKKDVLKFISS